MTEELQPVDNSGTTEPTTTEPVAPTTTDNSPSFTLPEKFQGKSVEDIAKSYAELEKKVGNYSELENKAKLFDQVSPYLESLKQEPAQPEPEPSKFETVDDLLGHMDKKYAEREEALTKKFEARLEAERKLTELRESYPEMKSDGQFRDLVITAMQNKPHMDVMEIAKGIREYLSQFEGKGREAAKKEFIEKGMFQGKSEGNKPYESDQDRAIKESIVGAGGKPGIF